jgi:plasmid stabilization system protein ParE
MMPSYLLAPKALADLRDVARYTKLEWGKAQVTKYRDQLE